jgi:hypothetical protein
MKFFPFFFFLLNFFLFSKAGDGVSDNLHKMLKTTTPLLRPQQHGYFLNVHLEENIDDIQKDAVQRGLESDINRLKRKLSKYNSDTKEDSMEINQERLVMRAISQGNTILD